MRSFLISCLSVFAVCLSAPALMPSGEASAGTLISGLSPYPDGSDPTACNGAPQTGRLYRNSETEPYIAVNPVNPDNMIAGWHQDRWSNGGAQGTPAAYSLDGGQTWTLANIPFTRCSGGTSGSAGDFERASDPWISYSPDGTAHYMALVFNTANGENGMAMARSEDGGVTWSDPVIIKQSHAAGEKARAAFHDKNSLTADPYDPDLVYATWTIFRNRTTTLVVARSTDGGRTWGPAKPVNGFEVVDPPEQIRFRQGAQIVVLPDIAVDRNSGNLYVVWQDARISFFGASNVMGSVSTDGGFTWSDPIPITGSQVFQHILPTVAVADNGVIGVLYYDFRNDDFFAGDAEWTTDVWLLTFNPDGSNVQEFRLTDTSFDMRQMVIAGGFFPGDYVGLDTAGNDFVAAFTVANNLGLSVEIPDNSVLTVDNNNRQDIVFKRVSR